MENKYQKALDWLKTRENWNGMCYEELQVDIRFDEKFKILQELIDDYGDYMSYEDLKAEYEKELDVYKKALDKACAIFIKHQELKPEYKYAFNSKDEWKEYLLKESEKQ